MTNADPFSRAAMATWAAGWRGVVPLFNGQKDPPLTGWTGAGAAYPSGADVTEWVDQIAHGGVIVPRRKDESVSRRWTRPNIGIRLPDGPKEAPAQGRDNAVIIDGVRYGVIALDVDAYKGAARRLAALEDRLGALPPTVRSSSRYTGPGDVGGHWFYLVPPGRTWKGEAEKAIEIIQAGHRYAVVWPSTNPDAHGAVYVWISPGGQVLSEVPNVRHLAVLPDAWVDYLLAPDRVKAREMRPREVSAWEDKLRGATAGVAACTQVTGTFRRFRGRLRSGGSRHDTALHGLRALLAFGGEGHAGVPEAVDALEAEFVNVATQGHAARDTDTARDEFDRMRMGAVRVAAARHAVPRGSCECDHRWAGIEAWAERPDRLATEPGAPGDTPASPTPVAAAPHGGDRAAQRHPAAVETTPDELPPLETRPKDPQFFGMTQDGMATALVDHYGHVIRYVPDGNASWYAWDGEKWALDVAGAHREIAKTLLRKLPVDEENPKDPWKTFKRGCLSATGINGITQMARTDRRIVVLSRELDSNPWALNTPDGLYDLRTGRRRPHTPDEMHTRVTAVAPDFRADRSEWLDFLRVTFGGDVKLIDYVWRLVGYTATGVLDEEVLPFCYGSGGNGKSVLLDVLASLLSNDNATGYASPAANTFLMSRANPEHATEIASLAGRRMIVCSEVSRNDKFDEAKTKSLVSERYQRARFMHGNEFTYTATHTLWLMGNDYPEVTSGGRSFWRRLRLIPFLYEVPPEKRETGLAARLIRDHGPAIMAWIVEGARAYAVQGLDPTPEAVKVATEEYAGEADHLARFLDEECHLAPGSPDVVRVEASRLYGAYESWCATQGIKAPHLLNSVHLGRNLKLHHKVQSARPGGKTFYLGIALMEKSDR